MSADALRLGMILPSSNTVVEPVACEMVAALAPTLPASVHFSRFALTAVQVADPAAAYYDSGALLGAARLLADARCHAICWNGSAGGLVGFARDRRLCDEIRAATGSAATTSSLAILDALRAARARTFGLVTLNPPAMNRTILASFAAEGFTGIASTDRDDIADNFAMAAVGAAEIAAAVRRCARDRPDAVVIYGTNTRGAALAGPLSRELGLPVLDSVAMGVIGAVRVAGRDAAALARWLPP
ncbi:MAG: Asp/Glu/hydantoin racemase [Burkholderiales bacterium]|nr:Asp/Glu/hydantoin racemase [Burkholderiales bacterium]